MLLGHISIIIILWTDMSSTLVKVRVDSSGLVARRRKIKLSIEVVLLLRVSADHLFKNLTYQKRLFK